MSIPPPPPVPQGGYGRPMGAVAPDLASAGKRMGARFLDGLILGVASGLIVAPIILSEGESAGFGGIGADGDIGSGKLLLISVLSLALGFVYEAVITKVAGGTPMKLAFGMRVVRADNGGPLEWSHATLRWLVPSIFGLIPLVGGFISAILFLVSLVLLFTDSLRQTISDKVAKTVVINAR